jgi:hypothetical protein
MEIKMRETKALLHRMVVIRRTTGEPSLTHLFEDVIEFMTCGPWTLPIPRYWLMVQRVRHSLLIRSQDLLCSVELRTPCPKRVRQTAIEDSSLLQRISNDVRVALLGCYRGDRLQWVERRCSECSHFVKVRLHRLDVTMQSIDEKLLVLLSFGLLEKRQPRAVSMFSRWNTGQRSVVVFQRNHSECEPHRIKRIDKMFIACIQWVSHAPSVLHNMPQRFFLTNQPQITCVRALRSGGSSKRITETVRLSPLHCSKVSNSCC